MLKTFRNVLKGGAGFHLGCFRFSLHFVTVQEADIKFHLLLSTVLAFTFITMTLQFVCLFVYSTLHPVMFPMSFSRVRQLTSITKHVELIV